MSHTLSSLDPDETAKDMIETYKNECNGVKVRPIGKLLEQLEVSLMLVITLK